jgi:transcriptional regulator with XRE-family HTH domain
MINTQDYDSGMEMRVFAILLRSALAERQLSQRAFAKAIGGTQSAVSHYLGGRAPPPLEDLKQWASVLGITPQHHARFILSAYLAHAPLEIEIEYLKQEQKINDLERQVSELEKLVGPRHAAAGQTTYRAGRRSGDAKLRSH